MKRARWSPPPLLVRLRRQAALLFALLPVLLVLAAGVARADEGKTDAQTRAEALKLAGEAMDLYEAGDYAAALEKFRAADELVPAPTLGLRMARCLDKLDRMTEAAEKYRAVIAFELSRGAPKVHRQAREQAVPELAALLEEMPSITVVVQGPGGDDAVVTMGGKPLPSSAVGEKQPLDPGSYAFEARSGDRAVHEAVALERGQQLRVTLVLPPVRAPRPGEPGSAGDDGATLTILGWSSVGIGGAGLVLGVVTGIMVLDQEGDLEARCVDRKCPPEAHEDAKSFDTMRTLSTVGFVVGGVGLAAGTTILLLAPSGEGGGGAARVGAFLTLAGGGVGGRF